ncbi:MAG: hypothetical protein A2057_13805 [Ignavibacteria bacterium GWA2_35_9]|nr:MAG: hypothetical protein A2057_13805 [Ignavibacteria bacterium GWA2_35_9]OGU47301.1 MAG: hypothetical protein A2000_04150 [Ignavibacteria bacterium GWB2_36_8]OGU52073.1 MAG: hypothetical protein A2080_02575 [Ignavibacteria bacterium GWC2_36_12]
MKSRRTKIPKDVADDIQFKSDLVCVVCEAPGDHIHHIDGNSSNNDPDNQVLLCFRHHDAATLKGSLSRKLSSGVLRKYREQHYKKVRQKRYVPPVIKGSKKLIQISEEVFFQLTMDALVCIEVEKIRVYFRRYDWKLI